jgi:hypothetical protein
VHYLAGAGREDSEDGSRDMQTRDARCGEHGESRMVSLRTECPPSRDQCEDGMTCARTADRFLYFLLLTVEWMLEPLLPREKTLATKT